MLYTTNIVVQVVDNEFEELGIEKTETKIYKCQFDPKDILFHHEFEQDIEEEEVNTCCLIMKDGSQFCVLDTFETIEQLRNEQR